MALSITIYGYGIMHLSLGKDAKGIMKCTVSDSFKTKFTNCETKCKLNFPELANRFYIKCSLNITNSIYNYRYKPMNDVGM